MTVHCLESSDFSIRFRSMYQEIGSRRRLNSSLYACRSKFVFFSEENGRTHSD